MHKSRVVPAKPGIRDLSHIGRTIAPTPRAASPEFRIQLEDYFAEKKVNQQAPKLLVDK